MRFKESIRVLVLVVTTGFYSQFTYSQLTPALQKKLDSLNGIHTTLVHDSAKAYWHFMVARVYMFRKLDSCITHCNKSAFYYEQTADTLRMYRSIHLAAYQNYLKGELAVSLKDFYKIEAFMLNTNFLEHLGDVYMGIGNNLRMQGDWNGAIKILEKADSLSLAYGDYRRHGFSKMSLAECHLELGNYEAADKYIRNSRRILKQYFPRFIGLIDSRYGLIKYHSGQLDSAYILLSRGKFKAFKVWGKHQYVIPKILNHLAFYHQEQGNIDSTINYASLAFRLAKKIPVLIPKENAARYLASAFEKKGNSDSALFYYKIVSSLESKKEKEKQFSEIKQLNKKVLKLKSARLLSEERSIKNRWVIIGVSSFVFFVMSILLLVNIRRKNASKREAQAVKLSLLKKENEQKEHELKNTTIELVKSNTSFNKLLEDIDAVSKKLAPEVKREVRSMLVDYKSQMQNEIWRKFNLEFKNANAHFYKKLKVLDTSLTETELKLATMHVSGLSNKEIAAITGQQLGSIYTHKSQLRKKFKVDNDEELFNVLNQIKNS